MNYDEALNKIYQLETFGIKLGLDNTIELINNFGGYDNHLKFIHVAGTNGKGSVCSIVAKALQTAGYKVGFFSSPHLVSFRERFRINGIGISKDELSEILSLLLPCIDSMYNVGKSVTFFEANVAIALKYFSNNKCDFVVWETGMGGRLDSTNIVMPILSIITGIGLDHQQYLGENIEKIAFEKSGIIKFGIPCFLGEMDSVAETVIRKKAKEVNSEIKDVANLLFFEESINNEIGWHFADNSNSEYKYFVSLAGEAQKKNIRLAFSVVKYLSLNYKFDFNSSMSGLINLRWPARFQKLTDGTILDGAHNPQGVDLFVQSVKNIFPGKKFKIVFGCLKERDPMENLTILSQIAEEFIFVGIQSSRKSFPPEEMANISARINVAIPSKNFASFKEAKSHVTGQGTIIVGSLYLAGEVLSSYYDEDSIINL